jgi:hypothetical protein
MSTHLCQPILERGIRNTHFFNGRLLAAEDLQTEQRARRQHDWLLGQAIGSGVVRGLEVTMVDESDTTVRIEAGLALTPRGQALELPDAAKLVLVRQAPSPPLEGREFSDCTSEALGSRRTGLGVYLLLVCPAVGFHDRVPLSGPGTDGRITGCGSKYEVDGVQFRLLAVNSTELGGLDDGTHATVNRLVSRTQNPSQSETYARDLSRLRNLLAHACYGTQQLPRLAADPFGANSFRYGAIDALRAPDGGMNDDDVPLAVVYWTLGGIAFVDMWAVRRHASLVRDGTAWAGFVSERRLREAEAGWRQFQDHIQAIQRSAPAASRSIVANRYLRYLPPAGLLPVDSPGSPGGFDPDIFFDRRTSRGVATIDGNQLRSLLHEALHHEPIDLTQHDRIQRYWIRENRAAVRAAIQSGANHQFALAFTSSTLPFRGTARFVEDSAVVGEDRWEESRFSTAAY